MLLIILALSGPSMAYAAQSSGSESALWEEIQKGNSVDDYQVYLAEYPKGKYIALARSRLKKLQEEAAGGAIRKDQEAWQAANQAGSEADYQGYLDEFPQGKLAGLAKVRIKKLQAEQATLEEDNLWQNALDTETRAAVQDYLDKYPKGRYVKQARQKDKEYKLVPARPQIPVSVSEDVWRTIEASEAYRNAPRSRMFRVSFNSNDQFKYDDPSKNGFSQTKQSSSTTEPLSDRCSIRKGKLKSITHSSTGNDNESTAETESYDCGFILLGSTAGGKTNAFIKSIDELKGSLFPMHVGARMLISFQFAYVPDKNFDSTQTESSEVVSQGSARELNSRLAGTAWKIHRKNTYTSNFDNKTKVTETDDYYLEDLGVMLSRIGVIDSQSYVLAQPGTVTNRKFDNFSVATTYTSYDWSVNEK